MAMFHVRDDGVFNRQAALEAEISAGICCCIGVKDVVEGYWPEKIWKNEDAPHQLKMMLGKAGVGGIFSMFLLLFQMQWYPLILLCQILKGHFDSDNLDYLEEVTYDSHSY